MSVQPPSERGRSSAFARIDSDGCASAKKWLTQRVKDKTREPLHPDYVKSFKSVLSKMCKRPGLSGARRRRRR